MPDFMNRRDLLVHAAECERALQVASETEQRHLLQQLMARIGARAVYGERPGDAGGDLGSETAAR
jgi:hypothetical protein